MSDELVFLRGQLRVKYIFKSRPRYRIVGQVRTQGNRLCKLQLLIDKLQGEKLNEEIKKARLSLVFSYQWRKTFQSQGFPQQQLYAIKSECLFKLSPITIFQSGFWRRLNQNKFMFLSQN